jgi:hypothetical protein
MTGDQADTDGHVEIVDEPRSVSVAVVEAVASMNGTDPTDLGPLNEAVDPDALEQVFGSLVECPDGAGHVSFRYEGYHVRVLADRTIEINPETADLDGL